MGSFIVRGTVAKPPEVVFDAIAAPANAPALFAGAAPGVVTTPGPVRAGSVVRSSRSLAGRTFSADAVVDVHRSPTELSLRGSAQGVTVETRWRLTPDGAATKVEFECRIVTGGLAALFDGAITDALRQADADHIERIRKLVGG